MFPNLAFLGIYGFTLANRSMCSGWRRLKQPGCESAGVPDPISNRGPSIDESPSARIITGVFRYLQRLVLPQASNQSS